LAVVEAAVAAVVLVEPRVGPPAEHRVAEHLQRVEHLQLVEHLRLLAHRAVEHLPHRLL
jgi:hypothetical protein